MARLRNWQKSKFLLLIPSIWLLNCSKPATIQSSVSMGEDIVRSMTVGRLDLTTLRTETKVEVSRGILRTVTFHASVLVRKPTDLFIQTSGFGIPATLVSITKKGAKIYVPSKSRLFVGDAEGGLNFLLPIGMTAREWISLLLGTLPEIKAVQNVTQEGDEWNILSRTEFGDIRYTIDEHSGWLKSYEHLKKKMKIIFGPPLSTPIGEYPSKLKFESGKNKIQIEFEKIEPNINLKDELFGFEHPKGIVVEAIPKATEE